VALRAAADEARTQAAGAMETAEAARRRAAAAEEQTARLRVALAAKEDELQAAIESVAVHGGKVEALTAALDEARSAAAAETAAAAVSHGVIVHLQAQARAELRAAEEEMGEADQRQEQAWDRTGALMAQLDEAQAEAARERARAANAEELAQGLRAATQDGLMAAIAERDAVSAQLASLQAELKMAEDATSPALQRALGDAQRKLRAARAAAALAEAASLKWNRRISVAENGHHVRSGGSQDRPMLHTPPTTRAAVPHSAGTGAAATVR